MQGFLSSHHHALICSNRNPWTLKSLSSENRFDINDSSDERSLQDQHEPASNTSSSTRLDIGRLWPSWFRSFICLSLVQYLWGRKSKKVICSAAQAMTTKSRSLPRFFFWRSSMTLGAPLASAPRRRSANHSLLDNAPPYCTSTRRNSLFFFHHSQSCDLSIVDAL
jgi:hypothetical protein